MKILIAPDSFKGTLTATQVCDCITKGLNACGEHEIEALPFADGGEGFADCMENICRGERKYTKCTDIYGCEKEAYIVTFGDKAVIECASASGLQKRKRVMLATSYGTGSLIKFAYECGYKNIILGLGGSGCCDGGAGALTALGAVFYDENQKPMLHPKGNDLNYIYGAGFTNILKDLHFTFACDVENPYCGKNGAAYVFALQKGANKTEVEELDSGLQRLSAFLPKDIRNVKGAGAAGGICGGLYSLYSGEIKSGFDILSEYADLENKIKQADLIITGEGKTDRQTLMGKLPYKISMMAKKYSKKCIVISGSIEGAKIGDRMISLAGNGISVDEAISNAEKILTEKAKTILQ